MIAKVRFTVSAVFDALPWGNDISRLKCRRSSAGYDAFFHIWSDYSDVEGFVIGEWKHGVPVFQ